MYGFYKDVAPWMIPKKKAPSSVRLALLSWEKFQRECKKRKDVSYGEWGHIRSCSHPKRRHVLCQLYHCPFAQPSK